MNVLPFVQLESTFYANNVPALTKSTDCHSHRALLFYGALLQKRLIAHVTLQIYQKKKVNPRFSTHCSSWLLLYVSMKVVNLLIVDTWVGPFDIQKVTLRAQVCLKTLSTVLALLAWG